MASDWHIKTQEEMIKEYKEKEYYVKKEKKIGFDNKVTRETQFKQVDIIATKGNEIILIEIEDLESDTKTYGELEYGIGYVELGGILFLSQLYSELTYNKSFIITLVLIFRKNIMSFRRKNIEMMIGKFKKNCEKLIIKIEYRE